MSGGPLGKYVSYPSFIHKMDPRVKLFSLVLLMVAIFFQFASYEMTFIVSGVLLLFIIFLMIISHVSFKSFFSSLKSIWFIVLFLFIINCFIPPANSTNVAFNLWGLNIYWESIFQSIKIVLRLIFMIALTLVLTSTTKPMDLTYALEWYMTPFKLIGFPAHEIAMTVSIALRFIPTLLEETMRIMKAQESRGVDFKHGKLSSRLRAIVSLIVPLFVSSFQRSEELADAMEARGYDPKAKRTRFNKLTFHLSDLFALLLTAIFVTGIILISAFKIDYMNPLFLPSFILGVLFIIIYLLVFASIKANWGQKR